MTTGLFTLRQVNQAIRQGAWSAFNPPQWVEYLCVAGGGAGGSDDGGGGGAGGLLTGMVPVVAGTSYTVTVGAGGTAGSFPSAGGDGVASVFGSISSTGGGGGGVRSDTLFSGRTGGSGGGSSNIASGERINSGGIAVAGQGNYGGQNTLSSAYGSGGGGGAGTVGINATSTTGGSGGAGIASAITGTVVAYSGGGGGSTRSGTAGSGGVGGGGTSGVGTSNNGTAGAANTGGGGGGGAFNSSLGGAGGSGIVVVRYPGNVQFYTGGTVTYSNGYIVHNFTANGTLAPTTPTVVSEYQISRSLRFNSADTATLSRTPASATSRKIWTWSAWVKRGSLGTTQVFFVAGINGSNYTNLYFSGSVTDNLEIYNYIAGVTIGYYYTTSVFRDPSAWYHIVYSVDTTQATAADRVKIYVNGVVQPTTVDTSFANSTETFINSANQHYIGRNGPGNASQYFDGYMTEVNLIDGQALTPTSFGYVNPSTGVWSPAKYVGGYGTNGFYLNFSDNSNTTAATLGADYSGNGNNWTPNNFSVSAGAGNDSLVDSPTSYGVDTGVGGSVRGNYSTFSPLYLNGGGVTASSYTNGNLQIDFSASGGGHGSSTISVSSGKWYSEFTLTAESSSAAYVGIRLASTVNNSPYAPGNTAGSYGYDNSGNKSSSGTATAYGASFTAGDVIGVALDLDAGTLVFYKNGASQGTAFTGISGTFLFAVGDGSTGGTHTFVANFGQRAFAYTAPSGFKALCTQNLPTPTISNGAAYMAATTFTATSGTNTIVNAVNGVGFQPDFVWTKSRSNAQDHYLVDSVRGGSSLLRSSTTGAESIYSSPPWITSFNSNGYSSSTDSMVSTGYTYVGWQWKANSTGVTNTAGSITSTVSANTTSGFSIVTYTGNSTSGATVGHGLGVTPSMVIVKGRDTAGLAWCVYHISLGATQYLFLNADSAAGSYAGFWNNTAPTSTLLSLGNDNGTNGTSKTYVAYCFAPVAGYSAFGSYTGNASTDGPFIYTGMRPAYLLFKRYDSTGNWTVLDNTRNTSNAEYSYLFPNLTLAEIDSASTDSVDFLSNGFKMRGGSSTSTNTSGATYIYMAFAQNPFKYSLAR